RCGVLPAGVVGAVGTVAAAVCGGGAIEPADSAVAARGLGVDDDGGAGHGGERTGVSGVGLATGAAVGVGAASGPGTGAAGREETVGGAGLSLSGVGDQFTDQRAAAGGVA